MVVRVNTDKIIPIICNRQLVAFARTRAGRCASQLYARVLSQFEYVPNICRVQAEPTKEAEQRGEEPSVVDVDRLLTIMNAEDRGCGCSGVVGVNGLRTTLGLNPEPSQHGTHIQAPPSETSSPVANGYHDGRPPDEEREPVTFKIVETQFRTLAQSPHSFMSQDPVSRQWIVDFGTLSRQVRNDEILRLTRRCFTGTALRVIRMLIEYGRLEEKALQEMGLLSARDLRQTLAKLHQQGFLQLQEVPREPQRQPSRTIYLWYYDLDQVRRLVLENIYKSMSRILARMQVERRSIRATLEKAERTDVQGREEKLLAAGEVKILRQWRKREAWLLCELGRLDDSVVLLRDL